MSFLNIFWTSGAKRLLILLGCFVMVVLPMMALQVAIDIRTAKLQHQGNKTEFYLGKPLYDEILDNTPYVEDKPLGMGIADWLLNSFLVLSVIFFLIHPSVQRDRTLLIRRTIVLMTWAYGLRIFTLSITRVPSAVPNCKVGNFHGMGFFKRMLNISESCSDMIYSGHTCTTIIILWGWLYNKNPIAYKVLAILVALASTLFFLLQRYHYTVDVTLGIYMAGLLALIYSLVLYVIDLHDQKVELYGAGIQSVRIKESMLVRAVRWIELRDSSGSTANKV